MSKAFCNPKHMWCVFISYFHSSSQITAKLHIQFDWWRLKSTLFTSHYHFRKCACTGLARRLLERQSQRDLSTRFLQISECMAMMMMIENILRCNQLSEIFPTRSIVVVCIGYFLLLLCSLQNYNFKLQLVISSKS